MIPIVGYLLMASAAVSVHSVHRAAPAGVRLMRSSDFDTIAKTLRHALVCARAAAQCTVIGPVCLFVGGSVTTINEIACIDPHPTGFVGKGSDHLQLIKFWPSRAPGKGVCGGAKIFGSALLQPARSVCVSLSAFFINEVAQLQCGIIWQQSNSKVSFIDLGLYVLLITIMLPMPRHAEQTIKE